ncbi:protein kinase domain-containing protein [Nocardia sp. NPDC004582]
MITVSSEPEPGAVIAGYVIERVLGQGGMGTVYLAQHPNLPRKIALKVLHASWVHDEYIRARFYSEADHAARLEHPNIVAIHDRGRDGDLLWIAMQYINGVDARSALQFGPLDPERAVRIVTEVGTALDVAHDAGVLHRDVKPANILLAPGDPERVFLTDFGTARLLDETHHLTRTGMVVATLLYASPEQIEGAELDRRVDVYALGCTCFHLLTGKPPYAGGTTTAVINAHLNGPIPNVSSARPLLPPALDTVLATALAKNRDSRYSTCREFTDALNEALGSRSLSPPMAIDNGQVDRGAATGPGEADATATAPRSSTPPAGKPPRRRRLGLVAAAAIVTLVVAAGGGYLVLHRPEHRNRETVLPVHGLQRPAGLAVAANGDLYIADHGTKQVSVLRPGSDTPAALPFTGLEYPMGLAVGPTGDVYVSDPETNRVTLLHDTAQSTLPFTGLNQPFNIALGHDGTLYVADLLNNRIITSNAGNLTTLPLSVIGPLSVAVSKVGDVYVGTPNKVLVWNAVVRSQGFLPFTDLDSVAGVAVDDAGNIYVNDQNHHRILKLPPASHTPEVLPFTGLGVPEGIAVSGNGDVYVADTDNSRIVVLRTDS